MNRGGGYRHRGQGRGGGRGGRGGRHHHRGRGGRHPPPHDRPRREDGSNYVHHIGTTGTPSTTSFTLAVQGCSHGELDPIYAALAAYRSQHSQHIDALLLCGDVQTLRNADDFPALNVPPKYKALGDFHAYYSGCKVAPILTIMVGGNHESSNYLQELHYGGWVAPNIYYLGAAGVLHLCKRSTSGGTGASSPATVASLRIAGISGIYNSRHYALGRYEMPPYDQGDIRSVYHTRQVEVRRLQALTPTAREGPQTMDVVISHDWPRGIYHHGNKEQLMRKKPFFRGEIECNELGSPANETLLHCLKPRYWFAAHLHVKFEAVVRHGGKGSDRNGIDVCQKAITKPGGNTGEATHATEFRGMEAGDGLCPAPNGETLTDQMTRFLSLDKCLPKRRTLEIMHVEPSAAPRVGPAARATPPGDAGGTAWLEYDAPWLAVLRRTHGWTQRTRRAVVAADAGPATAAEIEDVLARCRRAASSPARPLAVPENFALTVPPVDPAAAHRSHGPARGAPMVGNPQTDRFLDTLGMHHRITVPYGGATLRPQAPAFVRQPPTLVPSSAINSSNVNVPCLRSDDNEIDLDDDDDDLDNASVMQLSEKSGGGTTLRPQAPAFVRQPPTLIPSSAINSSNVNGPRLRSDDNEIDIDDNGDDLDNANAIPLPEKSGENEEIACVEDALDRAEIDLEGSEEEGKSVATKDSGGDIVVFSPPSSVAKKPRIES